MGPFPGRRGDERVGRSALRMPWIARCVPAPLGWSAGRGAAAGPGNVLRRGPPAVSRPPTSLRFGGPFFPSGTGSRAGLTALWERRRGARPSAPSVRAACGDPSSPKTCGWAAAGTQRRGFSGDERPSDGGPPSAERAGVLRTSFGRRDPGKFAAARESQLRPRRRARSSPTTSWASASDFAAAETFWIAYRTVVWSRPPKNPPISSRDRRVTWRVRYMPT